MEHVEWVNFDQINNAAMEGVEIQWETTQFWREIPCMEVVALMVGAQGEKAHKAYKEGDDNHGVLFFLWSFLTCFSLQLFSGDYSVV